MFKIFNSAEEMRIFEAEREDYYMKQINAIERNPLNAYVIIFKEHFFKKNRQLKKTYDDYIGGAWIDENGYYHTPHITAIPQGTIPEGAIIITDTNSVYYFKDNILNNIYLGDF